MSPTTPTRVIIGRNVKRLREEAGLTVIEASEMWGMTRCAWYLVERGQMNTSVDALVRIAEILQTTPSKLMQAGKNGKRRAA